jgi:hypothetical protein
MAKKKTKAENPFVGLWWIVLMPDFDEKYPDEECRAFVEIDERNNGEFHFGYVHGYMDCRLNTRDGEPVIEWTWDGNDEMDAAQGRGVAILKGAELHGTIFFHQGDDYDFVAKKSRAKKRRRK